MLRVILIGALLLTTGVWADEIPIGYIKNITGKASVTTDGDIIRAKVGTPIY